MKDLNNKNWLIDDDFTCKTEGDETHRCTAKFDKWESIDYLVIVKTEPNNREIPSKKISVKTDGTDTPNSDCRGNLGKSNYDGFCYSGSSCPGIFDFEIENPTTKCDNGKICCKEGILSPGPDDSDTNPSKSKPYYCSGKWVGSGSFNSQCPGSYLYFTKDGPNNKIDCKIAGHTSGSATLDEKEYDWDETFETCKDTTISFELVPT